MAEAEITLVHFDTEDHEFADQPPEFWKSTSSLALAKTIEQSETGIRFHPGWNHEFVVALARVKRAVPSSRWRRILARLEPGLWICCDGGPDWDPRVLGNGGVAIRNFHRVLGIDLEHGVSVSGVKHEQLLREVRTVLRRGRKTAESGVMLVHHGPQGIIFSQRVPVNCHFHGQSILFTSASLVEDLTVLGATASQAESPQEMLAIRLFPDTACVYTMYRHRDDADTLVESFALARFDLEYAFPASGILQGANVWPGFLEWVTENLDQELPSCDVPPSLQEDIRTLMTAEQPNSWAAQLFEIMKRFPPLFGKEPRYPPTVDPWKAWTHGRRRCCFYSFEAQASAPRVARAIAALGIDGAQPAKAAIASNGIHGVCCPYTNLAEARKVAVAFRRRFGPLRLTIPHLGLNHREPGCDTNEGNGAWFGFARRGGVKVPA